MFVWSNHLSSKMLYWNFREKCFFCSEREGSSVHGAIDGPVSGEGVGGGDQMLYAARFSMLV